MTEELIVSGLYDRFVPLERKGKTTYMKLFIEYLVITICVLSFIGGFFLVAKIVFDRIEAIVKKNGK